VYVFLWNGSSAAAIEGSNPAKGIYVLYLACCLEEISATGRSLVQRVVAEYVVFNCT
jgi:hypothetical protein